MSSEQLALYMAYTDEEWSPRLTTGKAPNWNTEQDDDDNPCWDMMDRE